MFFEKLFCGCNCFDVVVAATEGATLSQVPVTWGVPKSCFCANVHNFCVNFPHLFEVQEIDTKNCVTFLHLLEIREINTIFMLISKTFKKTRETEFYVCRIQ